MRAANVAATVTFALSAVLCYAKTIPSMGRLGSVAQARDHPSAPNRDAQAMPKSTTNISGTHSIAPRKCTNTLSWSDNISETYLIILPSILVAGDGMDELIDETYTRIMTLINSGDVANDAIPSGVVCNANDGFILQLYSTNNEQLTWSLASEAIATLWDYMNHNGYRMASFTIKDGTRGTVEVGRGEIGYPIFFSTRRRLMPLGH